MTTRSSKCTSTYIQQTPPPTTNPTRSSSTQTCVKHVRLATELEREKPTTVDNISKPTQSTTNTITDTNTSTQHTTSIPQLPTQLATHLPIHNPRQLKQLTSIDHVASEELASVEEHHEQRHCGNASALEVAGNIQEAADWNRAPKQEDTDWNRVPKQLDWNQLASQEVTDWNRVPKQLDWNQLASQEVTDWNRVPKQLDGNQLASQDVTDGNRVPKQLDRNQLASGSKDSEVLNQKHTSHISMRPKNTAEWLEQQSLRQMEMSLACISSHRASIEKIFYDLNLKEVKHGSFSLPHAFRRHVEQTNTWLWIAFHKDDEMTKRHDNARWRLVAT